MASVRKRIWKSRGIEKCAWVVDWKDASGKRLSKQFALKRDAEAHRSSVSQKTRRGIQTGGVRSATIADAGRSWLSKCKLNALEPTTIAAYEQHVRLHINPICGGQRIGSVTRVDAELIGDDLIAKLSPAMTKRVLRSLRAIGAEAERIGLTGGNVFVKVQAKRGQRRNPKVVIPLRGELMAMLRHSPMMAEMMTLPLVMLLLFTGIRASEARGLMWQSIDFREGTLTVERRADSRNVIGYPKSKSGYRTIPLPMRVVTALRAWKLACPTTSLNLVFPSTRGSPVSHARLNGRIFYDLQIHAGIFDIEETAKGMEKWIKRYSLHALRHAAASLWIEKSVSPKTIQTWMGHSSIQVTFDTYGHLFEKAELDGSAAGAIEKELIGYLDAAWTQQAA
ncbi:hypothetical protein A9995_07135 [Erythrobacter sp. QSSC1-22B]|uniref:tyrosine-type recombinase/integrase n=1 Tax=Erythrobacter sp. QSSC1-22B TaxID=1860125 RepID=UPI000805511C|nr:site-specific integrase [Erythrobacter sp. QSSC1-22B]OBX19518.1 hypothetical protein A9995_07135 [Erythrobacter sp. QSSC1-22B]